MQRILIIRLSAIGDIIMSTAILPGLRARYPDAHIAWLTEGLGAEILGGNDLIDELILLPRKQWARDWKAGRRRAALGSVRHFACELRARRFDWVIDLQGLLKSAVWARVAGAERRTILHGRENAHLLMTETVRESTHHGGRLCREYHVMAEHLGLPMDVFGMHVVPRPEAVAAARVRLSTRPGRPVLLLPFTTRPQKHWFEDRWVDLARRLAALPDASVWILGGPGDLATANAMAAAAGGAVGVVAGPESDLREKIALMSLASLAVGVDTGLTHLAYGLGVPAIALFGSTCPYEDLGSVPGRVFYAALDCAPCRRHPTCDGAFTCMRAHSVDAVERTAVDLLAAQGLARSTERP